MFTALKRRNRPRRGVTLVEMLVVVALVVLMMVILVQIFQSALGAMSASRTNQELDVNLRAIDSMIRTDLAGVTARMTPGMNAPINKQGYFEYGENAPADAQGEDTDDFLAFTTLAPEGKVFTGRQWLSSVVTANTVQTINQNIQPATITSQAAEVIYFLRNGNLYRRVFLVAPQQQASVKAAFTQYWSKQNNPACNFPTKIFGTAFSASWLGMNDISARPGGFTLLPDGTVTQQPPILNDLGDLTNRENRAFRPRFMNDFTSPSNPGVPDGIPDDNNGDGVNDYYPTLYLGVYNGVAGNPYKGADGYPIWSPNRATNEQVGYQGQGRVDQSASGPYDVYAFPFIYPGMYSVPDPNRNVALGWIHWQPSSSSGYINHAPLDIGDTAALALSSDQTQTWWGFPTWRESMTGAVPNSSTRRGWADPVLFVSANASNGIHTQPLGLRPFPPNQLPNFSIQANLLPPIYLPGTSTHPPFFDGVGSQSFVSYPASINLLESQYPDPIWEDDLILTNVRSFDVKAFDPAAPLYNTSANGLFSSSYLDLGYGSASYIYGPGGATTTPTAAPFQPLLTEPQGFGHEGRIPPLMSDFRLDPRRGNYIGDNSTGIIRLTRTFDTWSTDYTNAPTQDILLNGNTYSSSPAPIYPAFPPPYPSALRGIQIQIRITDPRNERTKVLTIRHDFSDKI